MNKIHEYRGGLADTLPLYKWLRANGEPGVSYKIHYANYNHISIEFFDNKLELMYIMRYDWVNREKSTL
jgi:hypothetical protein